MLTCLFCSKRAISHLNAEEAYLSRVFQNHSRKGFSCQKCNRFIPQSYEASFCPYPSCKNTISVKNKLVYPKHETIRDNPSKTNVSIKLQKAIDKYNQIYMYKSHSYTKVKYEAIFSTFYALTKSDPKSLYEYLIHSSHSGFQSKLFNITINNINDSLPYTFIKDKNVNVINDILDSNLGLFEGLSSFESKVDNKIINNKTKEIYVGSRNSYHINPYYIGKIISIIDKETNENITSKVIDNTFNYIKIDYDDKDVIVNHLMVAPHYDYGLMSNINRVKKDIANELKRDILLI